jgi:hypothetical protein
MVGATSVGQLNSAIECYGTCQRGEPCSLRVKFDPCPRPTNRVESRICATISFGILFNFMPLADAGMRKRVAGDPN